MNPNKIFKAGVLMLIGVYSFTSNVFADGATQPVTTSNGQAVPVTTLEQANQNSTQASAPATTNSADNFMNAPAVTATPAVQAAVPVQPVNPILDALRPADVTAGWGINVHYLDTEKNSAQISAVDALNFTEVRRQLDWSMVEKEKGVYDFSAWDKLMNNSASLGMRPILVLGYWNNLYDGGSAPTSKEGVEAFARFAGAAAEYFENYCEKEGIAKELRPIFEVYNETNWGFWKGTPGTTKEQKAEEYAHLQIATSKAIKEKNPSAIVLTGGLASIDLAYMEAEFKVPGFFDNIDGYPVHPYRFEWPETELPDYDAMRAVIAKYAPPAKRNLPIVATEITYYNSNSPRSTPEAEAQIRAAQYARQASYIVRQFLINSAAGVGLSIYYDMVDDGPNQANPEHRQGLLHQDLTPKPSYLALKDAIEKLKGFGFVAKLPPLPGEPSDTWRYLFRKDNQLMEAVWIVRPPVQPWTAQDPNFQVPKITPIASTDPRYQNLMRAASIAYQQDTLFVGAGADNQLAMTLSNPETQAVTVVVGLSDKNKTVTLEPGKSKQILFDLSVDDLKGLTTAQIPVTATWNGAAVTDLSAVKVMRVDPAIGAEAYAQLVQDTRKSAIQYTGQVVLENQDQSVSLEMDITNPDNYTAAEMAIKVGKKEVVFILNPGEKKKIQFDFSREDLNGALRVQLPVSVVWNGKPVTGLSTVGLGLEPIAAAITLLDAAFSAQNHADMAALYGIPVESQTTSNAAYRILLSNIIHMPGYTQSWFLTALPKVVSLNKMLTEQGHADLAAFIGIPADKQILSNVYYRAALFQIVSAPDYAIGEFLRTLAKIAPFQKVMTAKNHADLAAMYGASYGITAANQSILNPDYRRLLSNLADVPVRKPAEFFKNLEAAVALDKVLTSQNRIDLAALYGVEISAQTAGNLRYRNLLLKITGEPEYSLAQFVAVMSKVAPLHAAMTAQDRVNLIALYGAAYGIMAADETGSNARYVKLLLNITQLPGYTPDGFLKAIAQAQMLDQALSDQNRIDFAALFGIAVSDQIVTNVAYRGMLIKIVSSMGVPDFNFEYDQAEFLKLLPLAARLDRKLNRRQRDNIAQQYGISEDQQVPSNLEYLAVLFGLADAQYENRHHHHHRHRR